MYRNFIYTIANTIINATATFLAYLVYIENPLRLTFRSSEKEAQIFYSSH